MKKLPEPQRLDQLLVALGLFASRSRSRDAIQRGTVKVDGKVVTKPSLVFAATHQFEIDDPAQDYVSRAALKLVAALDHFGLSPEGRHCLDIGASTGGFTEVLLKRGAAHVTAIDVGHEQMHPRLYSDPRVTNLEGLNARYLEPEDYNEEPFDFLVSDVSFISLKLALAPALEQAERARIACCWSSRSSRPGAKPSARRVCSRSRKRRRWWLPNWSAGWSKTWAGQASVSFPPDRRRRRQRGIPARRLQARRCRPGRR